MSFYQFTEEQLDYATSTQLFKDFHKYLCDKIIVLDSESFMGDMKIYDACKKNCINKCASPTQTTGNYEILKDYSLAYLSPCVYQDHLTDDIATHNKVLSRITSKNCMEYWAFLHLCQDLATFIIYPICKILWPNDEFYLYHGRKHTVVINQEMLNLLVNTNNLDLSHFPEIINSYDSKNPLIFDFISISIDENRDWIFTDYSNDNIISSKKIAEWYSHTYGYHEFDTLGIKELFNRLFL